MEKKRELSILGIKNHRSAAVVVEGCRVPGSASVNCIPPILPPLIYVYKRQVLYYNGYPKNRHANFRRPGIFQYKKSLQM